MFQSLFSGSPASTGTYLIYVHCTCFNPCFSGSPASTSFLFSFIYLRFSFNLVFLEVPLQQVQLKYLRFRQMFQSLFFWKSASTRVKKRARKHRFNLVFLEVASTQSWLGLFRGDTSFNPCFLEVPLQQFYTA